jgi:protoporphyrinogen oxidase
MDMIQICIVTTGNGKFSDEEFQDKINSKIEELEDLSRNVVMDVRFTEGQKGKNAYIMYRVDYPSWQNKNKLKLPAMA